MKDAQTIGWPNLFELTERGAIGGQAINWDSYAQAYDQLPIVFAEYRENMQIVDATILPILQTIREGTLLDVGAGTGNYIAHYAELVPTWHYVHLDSNSGMNSVAAKKYSKLHSTTVSLVDSSAQNAHFHADSVDVVLCVNALYAMSPQSYVLRKMMRWLKPGGTLVCIDFGRKQRPFDWIGGFLKSILEGRISARVAANALGAFGNVFVQALRGAGGQASGQYWMHDLIEFKTVIQEAGFQLEEEFVCYRGYCDGVVARKSII